MGEPLWKVVQRKHARMLGGSGRTAWRGEPGPDSYPKPWLVVESESRKRRPAWIWDSLMQAYQASSSCQLAVSIFHYKGEAYEDDIVMMRLGDFIEWFGRNDDK